MGGLEERGQLGLPAAPSLQVGADAEGDPRGLFEGGDPLGGQSLGTGQEHRLLVGLGGRPSGQEFQERRLGTARCGTVVRLVCGTVVGARPVRHCGTGAGRSAGCR
ncbi:hypothetical protein SHIRM173S_10792 [Streptomyces hirsutus]